MPLVPVAPIDGYAFLVSALAFGRSGPRSHFRLDPGDKSDTTSDLGDLGPDEPELVGDELGVVAWVL